MKNSNFFFHNFLKLFKYLGKKEKLKIFFCIFMMTISSFAEVFSIGALIPFVTAILSPETLTDINLINGLFDIINLKNYDPQLIFTIVFIIAIIFANFIKVYVLYLVIKLAKIIPIELASAIYTKTLKLDYQDFKKKNSSALISLITEKMDTISGVFFSFLNACTATIVISGILALLFYINVQVTFISLAVASSLYIILSISVNRKMNNYSRVLSLTSTLRIKHIRETFGSIKQLILFDCQDLFSKIFKEQDKKFRLAQFKVQFLSTFPRHLIEALGMVLIVLVVYYLFKVLKLEPIYIITLVGALAFAAQRLLPQIHSLYISYIGLISSSYFIKELVTNLEEINSLDILEKNHKNEIIELNFEKEINLKDINFAYEKMEKNIIKSLNLKIKKGSNVAIIGKTGSGKSTLLDIIMGLLNPKTGSIQVDGVKIDSHNKKNWQRKISHVPQETFLFDDTILQNIAFEIKDNIDEKKIIEISKCAEIHSFIETLPEKYQTIIGENGILLSGGQKQRLGIARALYKNKEILTLDESTNALDKNTEEKILTNIKKMNITLIQITHRNTNQYDYDMVVKV
jgi:ATP-binding cassette, subfamily B, bacterial PglK